MLPARIKLTALVLVGILLAGFAIWAASGYRGDGNAPSDSAYRGSLMPPNVPIADFRLTDQEGKTVDLASLKGAPAMITFLYTSCKDVCPVTAQQVRGAMDQLGHDIPVVAISADPTGDSPERVRRWLAEQHLQGRMRWALGNRQQLEQVWQAWGVAGQTTESDHSAYVFVIDRDGRRCVSWPASQLVPEGLAGDLKLIESRGGICRQP